MRFGFHVLDFTLPGSPGSLRGHLVRIADAAESSGASWLTVQDHFLQMEQFRSAQDPMLESWSTLGFLAARTERVKLGTVVTGITYRNPAILAKTATTIDVLSGGRSFLGVGAAWYEREHLAYGIPYPPLAERFELLEETVRIALQMWSDDDGPFVGDHYRLAETINVPAAIQRPHPPLVIGGGGERKTLRLVARYADACNLNVVEPDQVRHKLEVLRRHCDAEGRDEASVEKTMQTSAWDPVADPDAFLRFAEAVAEVGMEHLHVRAQSDDPAGYIARFAATVAPRLAQIEIRAASRR
ncbi:MAG: LLM class F420-dependent oxidoreductase [Microbacterium sp.]|uniref:LLM class F420-dependent oxidoreductase n=1 Tax=Microbacterium sp. TaxID=51671 RepID=UPI001AD28991|nr:LLM class F420-dependent oxidoreductase [Microbacterium sp.]MBN9153245.1 LLM class F420-dependent oxidoreductase [Microbacterium sp.]MBN9175517.1 LLM class F420-dependent oxidoreductase [Microbacterium sp.]